MGKRRIVVLGGAISGPAAAARARETDEHADIRLLERSRDVSYAACALAYHASGEVPSLEALNRERADFFCGNPVMRHGAIEVTYWDFDLSRCRSVNLFADGTLGTSYLLTETRLALPGGA